MESIQIPLSLSTTCLLRSSNGYVQIDSSYEKDYLAYRDVRKEPGIELADIQYSVLTHHNHDAGFPWAFAPVFIGIVKGDRRN